VQARGRRRGARHGRLSAHRNGRRAALAFGERPYRDRNISAHRYADPCSTLRAPNARTERHQMSAANPRQNGTSGVLEVPMWHRLAFFVQPVPRP
jgi:hypothetical protein